MKTTGDVVVSEGKEFVLGNEISHGQEGFVYKVVKAPDGMDPSKLVVKLIKTKKMTDLEIVSTHKHLKQLKKLRDRVDLTLRKYFTLPIYVLDNELGYIMGNASSYESLNHYLDMSNVDNIEKWYFDYYSFKNRYQFITLIFEGLNELHKAGYVFTDLSPNNIMVKKEKSQKTGKDVFSIVFLDTDNIKLASEQYGGIIGTGMYMAPELCEDKDLNIKRTGKISVETDVFSAAVIAFQLITLQHPFYGDAVDEADGNSDLIKKACAIRTDYILKPNTNNPCTRNFVPYFEHLVTKEIAELFNRTFIDGRDSAFLRPTDSEFLEAFTNAREMIIECPNCKCQHLFNPITHKCFNCDNDIEEKTVFEIFIKRTEDISTLINDIYWKNNINIESSERFDVAEENMYINDSKPSNEMVISRVLMNDGDVKRLFKYHFEENCENRFEPYVFIKLIGEKAKIKVISTDMFPSAKLVPISEGHTEHQFKGVGIPDFPIKDYYIEFAEKKMRKGTMKICGRFIKE